jgi:hypothetical protein
VAIELWLPFFSKTRRQKEKAPITWLDLKPIPLGKQFTSPFAHVCKVHPLFISKKTDWQKFTLPAKQTWI